jgi:hypothetical protein
MEYKKLKYIRQKLDINTIFSNSKLFMLLQIKSIDIYQWINLKKQLIKFNVKIKACSVKLLKKSGLILPAPFLNVYNGKTIILYSRYIKIWKIKEFLRFSEKISFLISLFTFFKSRFLPMALFKKTISVSIKIKQFQLIFFLQSFGNGKNQSIKLLFLINNKNEIKIPFN